MENGMSCFRNGGPSNGSQIVQNGSTWPNNPTPQPLSQNMYLSLCLAPPNKTKQIVNSVMNIYSALCIFNVLNLVLAPSPYIFRLFGNKYGAPSPYGPHMAPSSSLTGWIRWGIQDRFEP